jgi:hypothetical protein
MGLTGQIGIIALAALGEADGQSEAERQGLETAIQAERSAVRADIRASVAFNYS